MQTAEYLPQQQKKKKKKKKKSCIRKYSLLVATKELFQDDSVTPCPKFTNVCQDSNGCCRIPLANAVSHIFLFLNML